MSRRYAPVGCVSVYEGDVIVWGADAKVYPAWAYAPLRDLCDALFGWLGSDLVDIDKIEAGDRVTYIHSGALVWVAVDRWGNGWRFRSGMRTLVINDGRDLRREEPR